jgi:hypothetical protein
MASLPLNNFRTITAIVSTQVETPYTCPIGFKAVFLMGQVTNIGTVEHDVTFLHSRGSGGTAVDTEIVYEFFIPPNDTLNLLTGKLVLETGDSIKITGSSSSDLKFLASILETSA